MNEKHTIGRRNLLKTVGAAALESILIYKRATADTNQSNAEKKTRKPEYPQVPKRILGKTKIKVPCLCIGTATSNLVEKQIILRKALQWGVTCWDTATNYAGGNSEIGIGKFLSKNLEVRKGLFIISKPPDIRTTVPNVASVERHLQTSLKRMNTKYVDLYLGVHNIRNSAQLTEELKQWVESAKKRKLIRFFGFSTHTNMWQCLAAAAKLDWIDAIITVYNFRVMQDPKMQAAIEACHKAGIGLIAIKTQAAGPVARWVGQVVKVETKEDKRLVGYFTKRGFTEGQTKIKAVLQDERFSSVCVGIGNVALLASNVDAVLDKTKLMQADMDVLNRYAQETSRNYCAGCAEICDSTLPDALCHGQISDIIRFLMYYNNYGDKERAKRLFRHIPAGVRGELLSTDYTLAEARCPQHLPIGKLVAEAVIKLS